MKFNRNRIVCLKEAKMTPREALETTLSLYRFTPEEDEGEWEGYTFWYLREGFYDLVFYLFGDDYVEVYVYYRNSSKKIYRNSFTFEDAKTLITSKDIKRKFKNFVKANEEIQKLIEK